MSFTYSFKYIIIGDAGVGKSSLLTQFIEKKFNTKYQMTVGVEFLTRTITIQDQTIKLQIWDTSGQESFRSITRSYYRSAAGAILAYDITKRESFANVEKWLEEAKLNGNPDMTFILIGNKCDLSAEREVAEEEGQKLAEENKMKFLEASAKTGDNVEEAFLRMSLVIYEKIEKGEIDLKAENVGIKKSASITPTENEEKKDGLLINSKHEQDKICEGCCMK